MFHKLNYFVVCVNEIKRHSVIEASRIRYKNNSHKGLNLRDEKLTNKVDVYKFATFRRLHYYLKHPVSVASERIVGIEVCASARVFCFVTGLRSPEFIQVNVAL